MMGKTVEARKVLEVLMAARKAAKRIEKDRGVAYAYGTLIGRIETIEIMLEHWTGDFLPGQKS